MFCLFCKNSDSEVIETRVSEDGSTVRRRRACPNCAKRFTTYERVEELPVFVTKKDGKRERYERIKLRKGIINAVGKTTVTADQIESIVNEIGFEVTQSGKTEVSSQEIGDLVAKRLKILDKVAYIRFASVFRRFVDVEEFEKELKKLL